MSKTSFPPDNLPPCAYTELFRAQGPKSPEWAEEAVEQRNAFLVKVAQDCGVGIRASPTLTSGEDDQFFRVQFALSLGLIEEA